MANLQTNRWYELTIGDGSTFQAVVITPPIALTFSVDKSSTVLRKQDTGQMEVYNLPDSALKVLQGDYPVAILKVGYLPSQPITILRGEVISVSTVKQGADKVTTILVGSGYVALNHETVQKVIPEGQSVKSIIEALRSDLSSISRGVYSGTNIERKALYGYSMSGTVKDTLDNLCITYHLSYRIDNNILYVHDAEGTTDENYAQAPLLNEQSGLIDIPYETRVAVGKAKKSVDNKGGVHFKCLLNPILQAGSIVRIESKNITGWFKLTNLRHSGGNRTSEWYTDCQCEDKNRVEPSQIDTAQSPEPTEEAFP
jgi:hypothetical protein